MAEFHERILSPRQRNLLRRLGPTATSAGFYLGGGTAIAILLGHRHSVDLDWFGDSLPDGAALANRLQRSGVTLQEPDSPPNTLRAVASAVPISFFEYRYPLLEPVVPWPDYGFNLASLDDLVAMKLVAITQRSTRRDFIDLYAIGTHHRPLRDLLDLYQRKYNTENVAHVLYGLSYFDAADKERSPRLLWDLNWRTVKSTIQRWVRELGLRPPFIGCSLDEQKTLRPPSPLTSGHPPRTRPPRRQGP